MPKNKPVQTVQPEDVLADHAPEVRHLAEDLRRLILTNVPNVREVAYPSWHGIGYHHPVVGYFCAIFPQVVNVKLGFEFGVLLPDPQGLLTGASKQVRYVEIRDRQAIPVAGLQALLQAARPQA